MGEWAAPSGLAVSFGQIDRLTHQEGLQGLRRGVVKKTTIRTPGREPATDLLQRNFTAAVPDQAWGCCVLPAG